MNNNMIKLNEAQLNQLVEECVMEVLNEGFFDKIGAAWKGMKQGYNSQKMIDRGTDNFKQHLSREDMKNMGNPMVSRPENTASEQAMEAYRQYKAYQEKANQMLNIYNKLKSKYNLEKTDVGRVKSREKNPEAGFGGPYKLGSITPTRSFSKRHLKRY